MSASSWDLKDITCILAGIPLHDEDIGKGEVFVELEYEAPDFEDTVGGDGHVTRFATNDPRATATIRSMQTSALNDRLMALLQLDRRSPNGAAVGGFSVVDTQGRHVISATQAWLMGPPGGVQFGKEPGELEWQVRMADAKTLATFHGGR